MQKLKLTVTTLTLIMALAVPIACLALPEITFAAANAKEELCNGIGGTGGANCTISGGPTVDGTISNVVNILSAVGGIAAVIMVIIGGFRFITSNGDAGTISSAKKTVSYALVGIVVIALSQAIVRFILQKI